MSSEQIDAAWPDAPRRSLEQWGKWGPPIPPKTIIDNYHLMRGKDPSRPVWLNLGQGVAWDGWHGRGIRTNKPEDYPQYMQGATAFISTRSGIKGLDGLDRPKAGRRFRYRAG